MDSTLAHDEPGSHNHHQDRAAVLGLFAARDLVWWVWWMDRRMSVAFFLAAVSWAGSVPSSLDQVDKAPARNTVCIQIRFAANE